ncbi:LysE family translocator [Marinomonas algarum]|uniref:LysE family translocator n=1 Tax=Marinomonas algarum TaxID=2883105 RepID=A0A9X1ILZ3_9GAMM|nr:LysE family translocator [Marinomonas algarum]MCB5161357.1 LysE family translocator [Marinomonas algarum]
MDITTWLSLATVCVMGALSPGPSLAVILRVSMSQSSLHGALAAVAHGLGIGFWAFLSLQGLAILMARYETTFAVLTLLGGLYLAWLGTKAWRFAGQGQDTTTSVSQSSYWESARDGFMIAILNPKIALFFLALFSQIMPAEMNSLVKLEIWLTVVLIDSGWYVIVALLLAGGPLLLWLRRHTIWVDRIMGTILISLGLKVVIGTLLTMLSSTV